jgi:predicted PurR-regulated permease PerM
MAYQPYAVNGNPRYETQFRNEGCHYSVRGVVEGMDAQWSMFTRAVVVAVSLIVIGLFLYAIKPMISPIIIAALVAYVLNPFVQPVKYYAHLSHKWAVFIVYFVCLMLLIVIPSLLTPMAIREATGVVADLTQIEQQLRQFLNNPIALLGREIHLGQLFSDLVEATTESLTLGAEGALIFIETTSTSLAWLLVILVSVYYFLLDGSRLCQWLVGLAPESEQPYLARLVQEIDIIWKAYLRGTVVLMIIVGVIFILAWVAIGLPGAVALGLLMGVLTVIPDLGPTIAAILAVMVAFFRGSDFLPLSNFWFAVLVFAIYFVLMQIKAIWLRPRIMGRYLHMNEGLIFVAIIGAVVLWGILGGLIIVPLLATFGVIGRYIRSRLLGVSPWPPVVAVHPAELKEDPASQPVGHERARPAVATVTAEPSQAPSSK